ncbi:ABC transporter permease subunit [Halomarina salina]|uniref:ABC transporter permease subunit n=1 Tax=Halomarina salina TaxID=1872699 RepID=A0ABD5RNQ4_9EURY
MSGWQSVAKKDVQDAVRSRRLLALVALFVLFIVVGEYLIAEVFIPSGQEVTADNVLGSLIGATVLLVPLIGLVSGYKAIAGERESGSYKLLLTMPHSRRDVVLGKFLGRGAIVATAIVAGFVAGAVGVFVLAGSFDVVQYAVFFGITLLYALAFVGLGLGISAATGSTSIAVMAGFGAFAFFQFLWVFLVGLVNDELFPNSNPELLEALFRVSPLISYNRAISSYVSRAGAGDAPFYQHGWFALLVLALWAVVPLTLGYLRFRSVDI